MILVAIISILGLAVGVGVGLTVGTRRNRNISKTSTGTNQSFLLPELSMIIASHTVTTAYLNILDTEW